MENLILRLDEDGATGRWAVFDEDGRLVSHAAGGPLEDAVQAARGRRLLVLVPGVEIVSTETSLPNASPARLRKMLPYSLEDTLAEDIDELVFAVGPRQGTDRVRAAVVGREKLERWLGALEGAGLAPNAVYSDADGVPDTPGTLTIVIEGERVYARAPDRPPFVFEGLPLDAILDTLEASKGEGEAAFGHAVVYVDGPAKDVYEQDLRRLPMRVESTDVKLMADGAWYRLASTLARQPGINLLQGAYAPKSNWPALLKPWRFAATLLIGAAVLAIVARGAEYLTLRHEDAVLTAKLAEQCAKSVGVRQLDRCESEVKRRLAASGQAGTGASRDFLEALAAVAGAQRPESRIEALSYRNATMDLQLMVPDVNALNAFVDSVKRSKRYDANIQSTAPGKDGVESRVQVAGANR
ncbi:MAG TPA: type II secretion system protein GspL [Gammaproteobacteria bacterium]|nr:type II secretion system protein GspL [Gammaproteobacteria bacterium]